MTKREVPDNSAGIVIFSSDSPELVGLPGTPQPVICLFCGEERHTEGFNLGGRIFWQPCGPKPCGCPDGQAAHEADVAERKAQKAAEEKAEADRAMRDRVQRIIGESGMGERFLQRTFENYIPETDSMKEIAAAAKRYADNFNAKLPRRGEPLPGRNGILITGPKGTGKTHIAAAIANRLLNRGTAVICMTERNLFGEIKRTYSGNDRRDESQVRHIYETVPLLIIDDLGKERPTAWTLATLYAIIDGRYDRAMPLIVTSNYDVTTLVEKLTPEGEDATTADTVMDRIVEMCKVIEMTGESWRSR